MKTHHLVVGAALASLMLVGTAWVATPPTSLWGNVLVLAVAVLVLVFCIGGLIAEAVITSKPANATWRERLERARQQKRTSETTNAPQEKA